MNTSATTTDEYIQLLPDWQQANLTLFRELIHKASSEVTEQIKWGVPVFLVGKQMVFAMASFKAHTKYNFILNGAAVDDAAKLFNNGFDSKSARGIDLMKDQTIDKTALAALIEEAISKL